MGLSLPSPLVIASVLVTAACWGIYGPVLHWGQAEMGNSRMRAFLCVGLAYFVIAVIVPILMLKSNPDDEGSFSGMGILWSSLAGVAGAIGALGIIFALSYGGKPVYVMPLVFGCAPVVNAFWTIYWQNTWKDVSPFFAAGLILVGVGAVTVLFFTPAQHKPKGPEGPDLKVEATDHASRSHSSDSAHDASDQAESHDK